MTVNMKHLKKDEKYEFIKKKLEEAGSKFITISFVKKDGSDRQMNIQYKAMMSRLKGDEASDSAKQAVKTRKENNPNLVAVYDVQKHAIRQINMDTVYKLTFAGEVYEL